jgi:pilus assembly protein CpaB
MNRRTRTLLVMLFAVVTAALASAGVLYAIRRMPARVVDAPTTSVVVAARALPLGVRLTEDDVRVVPWPEKTPLASTFKDVNAVLNRGLISAVVENEPIIEGKLAPLAAGGGLPPAIAPGMRAISVKVNEVIGVAGFVVPGARVDVLVTIRRQDDSASRVVVSNVQVLTAGTKIDQDQAKDGKPIPTSVVTLMVSPDDAERIALAAVEGQIVLTLRNPLDNGETRTAGARTASLIGMQTSGAIPAPAPGTAGRAARAPRKNPPPAAAPIPAIPYTVEAIRGAKRVQEVVK